MVLITVCVVSSITVTVLSVVLGTYSFLRRSLETGAAGAVPTGMVAMTLLVAALTTDTLLLSRLLT